MTEALLALIKKEPTIYILENLMGETSFIPKTLYPVQLRSDPTFLYPQHARHELE